MITADDLQAAGIAAAQAERFAGPLNAVCIDQFGLTKPARVAAFVAQAAHESARFTRLVENLNYTSPGRIMAIWPRRVPTPAAAAPLVGNPQALADRVYADRLGNGDEDSGDGWRYRGRGIFQITGRANYRDAGAALGLDIENDPDMLAQPEAACASAAWFWNKHGCNELIDRSNFDGTTLVINGQSMVGALERSKLFAGMLEAFA